MADEENEQSPWTRPGFIAAAVVIALIVVAGVIVTVLNLNRDGSDPAPTSTSQPTDAAPSPEPTGDEGGASVCGLDGVELSGRLSTAPAAEWAYQDTVAYPTSGEFGPGQTSPEGVRYCFQHSPEGALFAATNAVAQGSDPTIAPAWIEYFLAESAPNRSQLVTDVGSGATSDTRLSVAGFRLLAYDGSTARVEIAVRGAASGRAVYGSVIYNLVWEDGDWKLLPKDSSNPLQMTQLPDLSGYITWGE